jgi:hypothetical protein
VITTTSLDFIKKLGTSFEYEQTAAHDVSKPKIHRDIKLISTIGLSTDCKNGVVNGFLFWLHKIKGWSTDNIVSLLDNWENSYNVLLEENMKEFLSVCISRYAVPMEFTGFDVEQCRKATQLYRRHYEVEWLYKL